MKVGFITQLLWPRYGAFWQQVAHAAEFEPVFPTVEHTLEQLATPQLQEIRSVSFRIAAAQALALAEEAGMIIAPDVSLGVREPRGAGENPWIAALGDSLTLTFPELPPVFSVPAALGAVAEPAVLQFLQDGLFEPARVKRAWSRLRAPLYEKHVVRGDPFAKAANDPQFTGLIGQPWLFNDAVIEAAEDYFGPIVAQSALAAEALVAEGERVLERPLLPTDVEVIGAARMFARRAAVGRVALIVDPLSSSDAWLQSRVQKLIGDRLHVVNITDILPAEHAFAALYNAP